MPLSSRQQKFVDVYAGNGTEACRLAGYKGSDAVLATQAGRLLRNAEIKAAIRAREGKEKRPLIADRQARQTFWTKVMGGLAPVVLADGSTVDMPVEMKDRLKASELLGKSEADFTDKLEHSGNVSITVIDPYAQKPGGG